MRVFPAALCLLVVQLSYAQEEPDKFTMRGYLKDMATFIDVGDSMLFQNQIHNRLNFAWYASDEFTVYAEIRTRILTGDLVRHVPGYDRIIDSNNDYFDLSVNVINKRSILWNTMADRLYVQWNKGNWEIKVGRQRVNWGINLAWNPNDLFNAYSYFDFDYEERPGSDAIRISYYTGVASGIEVAVKMADDWEELVADRAMTSSFWLALPRVTLRWERVGPAISPKPDSKASLPIFTRLNRLPSMQGMTTCCLVPCRSTIPFLTRFI